MPERRHRAALDQRARRRGARPSRASRSQRNSGRQPSRRATGAKPCSNARRRPASAPRWLTRMISPPGLVHARELVERRLRVGHRGDDVLRDHHVEDGVGEAEMLRVHHRQRLDMGELVLGDALLRLAQHRLAR